jgi:hypothetical protein
MCSSPKGISTTRIQIPISGNKLTLSLIQNHQLLAALLPQQQPKPLFPEKTIPPPQLEPLTQPSTFPPMAPPTLRPYPTTGSLFCPTLIRTPDFPKAVDTIAQNDPTRQPSPVSPIVGRVTSPHLPPLAQSPRQPAHSPIRPPKPNLGGSIPQSPQRLLQQGITSSTKSSTGTLRPSNWDTMTPNQRRRWNRR